MLTVANKIISLSAKDISQTAIAGQGGESLNTNEALASIMLNTIGKDMLGHPKGVAELDENGKVSLNQLPVISSSGSAGKNLIINGGFSVWQRGASFTAPANIYTADRMKCNGTGIVSKVANGMKIAGSINLRYIMEDVDYNQIAGKTVTLSYSKNDAVISQTFVASSATVVNLNLSDCIINWIKLESGSNATGFLPRLYVEELMLCQRYYERGGRLDAFAMSYPQGGWSAAAYFKITKRVVPTVVITGTQILTDTYYSATVENTNYSTEYIRFQAMATTTNGSKGHAACLIFSYTADAEI